MDKITVVCHKDHVVGYEDYAGKCLLCEVERLQKRDSSSWVDCTDEQLMEEVRRRGFVIRDAQIGREWVGLTDDERSYYLQAAANVGWWQAALFVENKLKEKNT